MFLLSLPKHKFRVSAVSRGGGGGCTKQNRSRLTGCHFDKEDEGECRLYNIEDMLYTRNSLYTFACDGVANTFAWGSGWKFYLRTSGGAYSDTYDCDDFYNDYPHAPG